MHNADMTCKKFIGGRAIRALLFLSFTVLIIGRLGKILQDKTDRQNFEPFYDSSDQYDVLFLGSSTTMAGISPLDLFHDYGIASFNLANSGQNLPETYWALKSACNYQNPSVVVVDVAYLFNNCKYQGHESRAHQLVDNMPRDFTRVKSILDLIPVNDWISYFFPAVYYHQRWEKLEKRDFFPSSSINYGCTIFNIAYDGEGKFIDTSYYGNDIPYDVKNEMGPEINYKYIEKMVEHCRNQGIDIVFVEWPCYCVGTTRNGDGEQLCHIWDGFSEFAEELGVEYINGVRDYDDFDFIFSNDLRDWAHANVSGNRKMTTYIGRYIRSNYSNIPDRRNESRYDHWNAEYEVLCTYKNSLLEIGNDSQKP